jgi:PAS domain S-box-containing protein
MDESLPDALQETLALFEEGGEPQTTTEVTEQLDLGRRGVYDRLERLVEEGYLETKKVGASARVWWRPATSATGEAPVPADGVGVLLGDVLDDSGIGAFVLDEDRRVVWHNESVARYFGLDGEIRGREKRQLIQEQIAAAVADPSSFSERVLSTYEDDAGPERFECHVTAGPNREERWLEHRSKPIESGAYAGGRVEFYYDVTERKRSERASRRDREEFESLVEAVEEYAIFTLDPDGYVRTWNPGVERIKGYEAEEVLGEHFSTFYTEEDRAAGVPERNLERAAEVGSIEDEGWRVRADGSRFWATVTITAIRDDDGDLQGFAKVTRDSTERREYEQRLRRERDLIEQLFETSPVGIAVFEADGELARANAEMTDLLEPAGGVDDGGEYAAGDLPLRDEDGERLPVEQRPVSQVLETGEPVSDRIIQVSDADGNARWMSVNAAPITDADGDFERVVATTTDITQLKRQARRLERQRDDLERELADVFDRVDDAFFALDEEWRFTYVNESAADLVGLDQSTLGTTLWETFPEVRGTRFERECERAMETQEPVQFEAYFDPLETWFEVSAYPSPTGLSVYFRDVTERKRREQELERYEAIVETVDDGVYTVDEDGYFTQVNEAYAEMVGRSREELVGANVSTVVDEETRREAKRLEEELLAGERATAFLTAEFTGPDGDVRIGEATFALLEAGSGYERIGVVRDVTERKRREQELERYETMVETVDDGIYAVDEDGRFVLVNDALCDLTGYDREELIGAPTSMVHEVSSEVESILEEMLAGGSDVESMELDILTAEGEAVPCETRFSPFPTGGGNYGRCGVVRDITERLERERELQTRVRQQEVVTELGEAALASLDPDALMAEAAERVAETLDTDYCKVLDLDVEAEELLLRQGVGWHPGIVGAATVSAVEDDSQASYTLRSERPVVVEDLETEARFGGPDLLTDHGVRSGISTIIGPPDDPWGILGTHDTEARTFSEQDVNFVQSVANILANAITRYANEQDLVRQREELRRRERALSDAYRVIASREPFPDRIDALLALVRDTVGTDYATLSKVQGEHYVFEAVDAPPDADLEAGDALPLAATNCERVVETGETLAIRDVEADAPELADRAGNDEWGVSCYLGAPVTVGGEVYGTFCFYDTEARPEEFSDWEVAFVELLSNWVGAELERQQYVDRLDALNSLHGVAQEITHAALEQSTRDEIEAAVCERLAASDSYEFAWIGDVDVNSDLVTLRAEAGVEDYLDDVTISVDPADERSEGPTGRAFRTREIQVSQDVQADPSYSPWEGVPESYGFRSSAAVPIVHEDVVYGVLNIYAARARAFEGEEREVVSRLGEVVGHAIAAAEQKQALMSDDVVELEFRVRDIFDTLGLDGDQSGRIRIDHTIPLGDEEFLVYGTVTPDAVDDLEALVGSVPHWEDLTLDREDEDTDAEGEFGFELRVSEPPVLSVLASMGGAIEEAVIEDGDYRMTLHVSPNVEVRQIVNVVQEAYPTAEMMTRRRIIRADDGAPRPRDVLTADLTERQRAALEAAYRAGFFEWPRDASGEDVADSLGVTPPTFHQHLRTAEAKILDSLLSEHAPPA